MTTLLEQDELRVRLLEESDVPLLARWLSDPRVLEWYEGRDRPHDEAMVREDFLAEDEVEVTHGIVELDGQPIGYLQLYALNDEGAREYGYDPGERSDGLDLFIGETGEWGRGVGTRLVRALAEYCFRERGALRVTLDPRVVNGRAIRCYEKAGFRQVRLLPRHELHEGQWHDCWLMARERDG